MIAHSAASAKSPSHLLEMKHASDRALSASHNPQRWRSFTCCPPTVPSIVPSERQTTRSAPSSNATPLCCHVTLVEPSRIDDDFNGLVSPLANWTFWPSVIEPSG